MSYIQSVVMTDKVRDTKGFYIEVQPEIILKSGNLFIMFKYNKPACNTAVPQCSLMFPSQSYKDTYIQILLRLKTLATSSEDIRQLFRFFILI